MAPAELRGRLVTLLRRARLIDHFLVLSWAEGTFGMEIKLGSNHQALLQCRIREVEGQGIELDYWMQPQSPLGPKVWEDLTAHFYASDMRIVTEVYTMRVAQDLLEHRAMTLPLGPGAPPVSSDSLMIGARASHSVSLKVPGSLSTSRLFALLCRSCLFMSSAPLPQQDDEGSLPTAFVSLASKKDVILLRVDCDAKDKLFTVSISEVRVTKLGRAMPAEENIGSLLGHNTASSSSSSSPGKGGKLAAAALQRPPRNLRPDVMGLAEIASKLHARNLVRCAYSGLVADQDEFPPGFLDSEIFPVCLEVGLEVNLSEMLQILACLPESADRKELMEEGFLRALNEACFRPISGSDAYCYVDGKSKPLSESSEISEEDLAALLESKSLPPRSTPPPTAISTWDEESLLTLQETEVFGAEAAMPFFLRMSLDSVHLTAGGEFRRVLSSRDVRVVPLRADDTSVSSYLKLSCLTLPPYRTRAESYPHGNARAWRLPAFPEPHSPFKPNMTDLPPRLAAGMSFVRTRIQIFVSTKIVELLRYLPLDSPSRRELLVTHLSQLTTGGRLLREQWAPRLCRDGGPALMRSLLPRVAKDGLGMEELTPGGSVTQMSGESCASDTGEPLVPHWLVLGADEEGGLAVSLFGNMPEEQKRSLLRAAETCVWVPLLKEVNQRCLLRELHDTRQCPALLVAPGPTDPPASLPNSRDARFGTSGSLGCPAQGDAIVRSLPNRLTWEAARRAIARTMSIFAVEDRRDMYVYTSSGEHWYFVVTGIVEDEAQSNIHLKFFGLVPVPMEITADVTRLLEGCLAAATVSAFCSDAMRHPTLKVSSSDMEFLHTKSLVPDCRQIFLPKVGNSQDLARARFWDLFHSSTQLHPLWHDGADGPSHTDYVVVSQGSDGLAVVRVVCKGDDEAVAVNGERPEAEEFFRDLGEWESASSEQLSDEDNVTAGYSLEATVWAQGSMDVSTALVQVREAVRGARGRVGLEQALMGSMGWQLRAWPFLGKADNGGVGDGWRLKGLSLLAVHMQPLIEALKSSMQIEGAEIFFHIRDSVESPLCEVMLSKDGPRFGFDNLHAQLVLSARISGVAAFVAIVTREQLELRAYGVSEDTLKAAREAATTYLSWSGLRTHMFLTVVYAKLGIPYHRNFGKRLRLPEGLLETIIISPLRPGSESVQSSSPSASNSLSSSLKAVIPRLMNPRAATDAFIGLPFAPPISVDARLIGKPVSRHIVHELQSLATRSAPVAVTAPPRLISVAAGSLYGMQESTLPLMPMKRLGEAFYSHPRSNPMRLAGHNTWICRLALRGMKAALEEAGFTCVADDTQTVGTFDTSSGTFEITAALMAGGKGMLVAKAMFIPRAGATVLEASRGALAVGNFSETQSFVLKLGQVQRLASIRGIAMDAASSALAALASGQRCDGCWSHAALRGAEDAAVNGGRGHRSTISTCDLRLPLPTAVIAEPEAPANAFEVLRYLAARAQDYGLCPLSAAGVEPALALSLPAAEFLERSKGELVQFGLSRLPTDEQWSLVAMYVHVRGEDPEEALKFIRLRILFARTPVSGQAPSVAPASSKVSSLAFSELLGAPLRRVLADFSRDVLWRQLHMGENFVDCAELVNASAVLSAAAGEIPSLAATLKTASVPSWDSLLSHLQRWRPACLRPWASSSRRHVLILQRLPQSQASPSPAASLRAISTQVEGPAPGLLPELARLQAGASPNLPDFVALLSRPDTGPLTLSLVRRSAEDVGSAFRQQELDELDEVIRALGIWLWMLNRNEKQ